MTEQPTPSRAALVTALKTLKLTEPLDWVVKVAIPVTAVVTAKVITGTWSLSAILGVLALILVLLPIWVWNLVGERQVRAIATIRAELELRIAALETSMTSFQRSLVRETDSDPHPVLTELDELRTQGTSEALRLDRVATLAKRARDAQSILGRFDEFERLVASVADSQPLPLDVIGIVRGGPENRWVDAVGHIRLQLRTVDWVDAVSLFPVTVNQEWRVQNDALVAMEPGDEQFFRNLEQKQRFLAFKAGVRMSGDLLTSIKASLIEAQKWTSLVQVNPD